MAVTVGPMTVCGQNGQVNEPCASVTICQPGTSNCQTITDVLIDTGSFGLRVFASLVTIPLPQATDGQGRAVVQCEEFGIGSDWGPLVTADIQLAGEPLVRVPIQLIEQGYATAPSGCSDGDTDPVSAGYNGILGVGPLPNDCGSDCATDSANGTYFTCTGSTCTGITVPIAYQQQNPIQHLSQDNNGVILSLPAVASGGAASVNGSLTIGIGTRTNNTVHPSAVLSADEYMNFGTTFNGKSYPASFIDSGSSAFFFTPPSGLPDCSDGSGFFCPTTLQGYSATQVAATGGASHSVTFSIANADNLSGSNDAFDDIGADLSQTAITDAFDWGLPFFYGRSVAVGMSGESSSLGSGAYWAY